jgi:hypothetical protein
VTHNQRVRRVRVPAILLRHEVGLGTVITRLTSIFRAGQCGSCVERAAVLDRRVIFYSTETRGSRFRFDVSGSAGPPPQQTT